MTMEAETEVKNDNTTPAGAEGKQESAPTAKPEATAEPTIREKMFGGKVAKKEDKSSAEPEKPAEQPSEATDGNEGETAQTGKKTAKDRIQESRREVAAAKAATEAKAKELEAKTKELEAKAAEVEYVNSELQKLKAMKEEDKTTKDLHREVMYEERMRESMAILQGELDAYAMSCKNPQMFVEGYNYYTPLLAEKDVWTVKYLSRFPERFKMMEVLYDAFTNGVFTVEEWAAAPRPMKMQKIMQIQKIANDRDAKPVPEKEAPAKPDQETAKPQKVVADSVVPDFDDKHAPENTPSKGAAFKRSFEAKRRSGS